MSIRSNHTPIIFLIVLALACMSCAKPSTPTHTSSPESTVLHSGSGRTATIEWPYGQPDDTQWDDESHAVATLRAAESALAVGLYLRDWSGTDLQDSVSADTIRKYYNAQFRQATEYDYNPERLEGETSMSSAGPVPYQILEVKGSDSGYTIYTCTPENWQSPENGYDPRTDDASYSSFDLQYEEDGELRLVNQANEDPPQLQDPTKDQDPCDFSDLRYGYFTPQSDPQLFFSRSEVIDPDGVSGAS